MIAAHRTNGRRVTPFRLTVVVLAGVLIGACAPASTPPDKPTLRLFKQTEFGTQASRDAALIAVGRKQPVLEFTVEDTPPSIFVNYIVPDAQAAEFADFVDLPPGFSLAKVRILESDPVARFWLSVNVYRVSGITTGLRTEWSTYVNDGSGVPRFMIIRARASQGSIDPIGPLAPPEPFTHAVDSEGVIRTAMNRTEVRGSGTVVTSDNLFTSTITLPEPSTGNYVVPTREWVTANDFIYWTNGVNDRIFHNSTSHSAPLVSVDLADVTLDDDTEWAPFVNPVPGHVLVYLDKLQFMIGPWWNVTEPDGRVDPKTRGRLFDLKKTMYGGLTNLSALAVLAGTGEPILQSTVEQAPPSAHWHWKIPAAQMDAFETAANVPAGLTLAATRLQEGDTEAAQWLSLNVSFETGSSSGLRAEWTTSVDDGSGVRTLILDSKAGFASIDPVHLRTSASPITHSLAGNVVSTTVGTGPAAFSSTFSLPPAGPATTVLASRQWVGSSDLRYWSNGVADRVFYDSTVFDPKTSVDPASASITNGGAWAVFAGGAPDRLWVDPAAVDRVTNPWWNLNDL